MSVYRWRVVRHSCVLVVSGGCAQAAGVVYAQPGERRLPSVAALSLAALANVSTPLLIKVNASIPLLIKCNATKPLLIKVNASTLM